jgi:translation initiation factor 4E
MSTDVETVSVTHSSEFNALQTPWCMWVMSQHGKVAKDHWQANQTKAGDVTTVEDFWRLTNHIQAPSRLGSGDYSLFRQGITPAWEDPVCQRGGRWVVKSDKLKVC